MFGVIGYCIRRLGFPLAPMILGVVLGSHAEWNLSRALATSDDLTLFFTRPWSLFFVMIATFSAVFPWYQAARGRRKWTLLYMPLLCLAVAGPMLMMNGWVRPGLGVGLLGVGGYLLWRRARTGWRLEPPEEAPAGRLQAAGEQAGRLEES